MAAQITVVVGPARSGKSQRLLSAYRSALAAQARPDALDCALWIAPSRRTAEKIRDQLITPEMPACFGANILTFENFADRVLDHADDEIRPIDERMKKLLLEQLIGELHGAGRLQYFAAVAETPGLVELVAAFIADLKRAEIWPDEFEQACKRRARNGKWQANDRELHALYAAYQDRLVAHRLYDAEGRSWAARDRLQQGQTRPFQKLKLVVIDGFTDLTQTQQEIVDLLAKHVDQVYLSLLNEDGDGRDELFRRPRKTLDALQQRHANLRIERLSRTPQASTPLAHIERELFKNPRDVRRSADAAGVEILAATGRVDEIEQLARRIKGLLLDGDGGPVRPDDVAVVFRSLNEAAPLVREVFARFGLPTAVEAGRRLDQSPALTALAALVELDGDDWPFRHLLAVTGGNFFGPNWPEWHQPGAAAAVEATIRSLQLPSGREALLQAVDKLATTAARPIVPGTPEAESAERHNRRRDEAILAAPVLRRLAAAFDALPRAAVGRDWAAALQSLARETGLTAAMNRGRNLANPESDAIDRHIEFAAWNKFQNALCSPDDLTTLLGDETAEFDRARLRRLLQDVIRAEQLPGDHDEVGRIRVLSAVTARNLSIPYVFLAGLTEKSFPNLRRDDALYGDAERQALIDQGLRLPSSADRFADEMLLFYEAVTRAERKLWLSFPSLNEKAEPLLPSPYLVELQELFEPGRLPIPEVADLSAIPPDKAIVHWGEHRVRAVAAAANGATEELSLVAHRPDAADVNLLRGLDVVYARGHGRSFGSYEGVFSDRRALQLLSRRFDLDHPWSAAQLERYHSCPYQFFLQRVLGLRVLDDIGLEIDPRGRGSRLHEVLALLHGAINERFNGPTPPSRLTAEQFAELLDQCLEESTPTDPDPVEQAVAEIDRQVLRRWFADYLPQFDKYDEKLQKLAAVVQPAMFEVSFGLPIAQGDIHSTATPLTLRDGDESVQITGRIDRIDVGGVGEASVFCIIDYKSSKRSTYSTRNIDDGGVLQLPLYSVAAQELLFVKQETVPLKCGYWVVGDGGYKEAIGCRESTPDGLVETGDWTRIRNDVVRQVFEIVRGIRRGEFPMVADKKTCANCDFRTICRVQQTRALEKTWPAPPANQP